MKTLEELKQEQLKQEQLKQDFESLFKDIREFVGSGNYIFRGEAKEYDEVSSKLYRELTDYMEPGEFNMKGLQKEKLKIAKRYTKEENDDRILEELQHLGGSTNQIDFTTDYLVALFFACDDEPKNNGRLIFLDKGKFKEEIHEPKYPQNRVIAQKSVFVRSFSGVVKVKPDETITINNDLKPLVLHYLRQHHNINAQTIYNDIHGYITRSEIHKIAHKHSYLGLMHQDKFNHELAIEDYTKALECDPSFDTVYNNRGVAYDFMGKKDLALADYNKAIELNPDYASAYSNRGIIYSNKRDYGNAIADYDTAIKLNPSNALVYVNRGDTKKILKDIKGAKEDFEIALRLAEQEENNPLVDIIRKRIDNLPADSDS